MPENVVLEITEASSTGSFTDEYADLSVKATGDIIIVAEKDESVTEIISILKDMIAEEREVA